MTLYSLNGQRPGPLPFRIHMPDGSTRTDPSSFTEDEITAAGYIGPFLAPEYDPSTEELQWDGSSFSVTPLPPPAPQPAWGTFKQIALESPNLKGIIAQAYQSEPVAAGALASALLRAENGCPADFGAAWSAICKTVGVSSDVIESFVQTAQRCNLPEDFVVALDPRAEMKRARDDEGRFLADDPFTPDVNEAWVR